MVSHVDARKRQADIVDDVIELVGRDGAANGLLDEIKQAGCLFDARAWLGAHVHKDLAGIHRREEVLAQEWLQPERENNKHDEADDHGLRPAQCERQHRSITAARPGKEPFEAGLKALERVS